MRVLIFMTVMPLVWGLAHYYLGRRFIAGSKLRARGRKLAWAGLFVVAVLPLLTFIGPRVGLSVPAGGVVVWSGFLAMGLSSILLTLSIVVDVTSGVTKTARRIMSRGGGDPPEDPSRRQFMGNVVNAGLLGTTTTVGGVGVAQATSIAQVVDVEVPIAGLPRQFEGFTIVQLSDVHVGPTIRRADLQAMVDRANELDGDVIAVTGDLIDGFVPDLRDQIAPIGQLRARHGVYFVTGNHEYYWNGPQWCEHVASLGLRVLNNEHEVIERDGARLLLAGVTDVRAGEHVAEHESDPAGARRGAGDVDVSVLLAHQPRSIYAAADAGYDLQLSGHTHGGQYFPMNILVHLAQPYVAGLHRHGPTWIYVSRGTGYWGPPLRVGAPHEITRIRLAAAP
jgi:predicted MPP superfamily phosphohydrolase